MRPSRRARWLYRFSGRLRCRLIRLDGKPYLERYYLGQWGGVTFYLHRFLASDGDREVHDHPWRWSCALFLSGGYREERLRHLDPERGWVSDFHRLRTGSVNRLSARSFHRVIDPEPETWTLFVHGPRIKRWGFLQAGAGGAAYRAAEVPSGGDWKRTAPRGDNAGREALYGSEGE